MRRFLLLQSIGNSLYKFPTCHEKKKFGVTSTSTHDRVGGLTWSYWRFPLLGSMLIKYAIFWKPYFVCPLVLSLYVWMCVHVYIYAGAGGFGGQRITMCIVRCHPSTLLWRQGLSLAWSALIQLGCLASNPPGIFLSLNSLGLRL